uniref:Uncharacterized protein n=1 Tax=viral metagenome TaxID=1070528 RepID=A0A6M3J929_9ZZZZ
MWRPKDWINPYLQQDKEGNYVDSRCFEAGADAMLKVMIKRLEEKRKRYIGGDELKSMAESVHDRFFAEDISSWLKELEDSI